MKIVVDTNMLLDFQAEREPYYRDSAVIWSLAESGRIDTNISSISFNNIVHIARKQEDAKKSFEAIMFLRDVFKPVAPDAQIINQAIDAKMKDFEDAIQYVSATRAQVDFLVTRNPDDFHHGPIPVCTPAEFVAMFETEKNES